MTYRAVSLPRTAADALASRSEATRIARRRLGPDATPVAVMRLALALYARAFGLES